MRFLLDTHLLLWVAGLVTTPKTLSKSFYALVNDSENELYFSVASVWEVAIKQMRGRPDFEVDAYVFRRGFLDHGYLELPITGAHAAAVTHLPPHHKDPFDRMLIAQATVEGITLLTNDTAITAYTNSPIRYIK